MPFDVPSANHFEGGANLTKGSRKGVSSILSEILRKTRTGQTTHAGAGTVTLTFSEAFDDTNYIVSAVPNAAGIDPIYANKTAESVDVTVTGAGVVDVIAIHD